MRRLSLLTLSSGIFLIPLLFLFATNQIFEVNKFFGLSVVVGLLAIFAGIEMVKTDFKPVIHLKKAGLKTVSTPKKMDFNLFSSLPILLGGGIFFLSLLITPFFAENSTVAFFGDGSRHQGSFFWLSLLLLTVLVARIRISSKELQQFLFFPLLASGIIISGIAIFQYFGIQGFFESLATDDTLGRSFSTLGQPNFLGQFLLFPIFVSLYFLGSRYFSGEGMKALSPYTFTLFLFLFLFALFTTSSRGGMLGFLGGILFLASLWGLFRSLYSAKKLVIFWSFVLVAIVSALYFATQSDFSFLDIFGSRARSVEVRLRTWHDAIPLISFFGIGFEHFRDAFLPLVSPEVLRLEGFAFTPDRAHNIVLDMLVSIGVFGTVGFFLFLGGVLSRLDCFVVPLESDGTRVVPFLHSAVFAVLLSWLFGFPVTTDAFLFFVFLGVLTPLPPLQGGLMEQTPSIPLSGGLLSSQNERKEYLQNFNKKACNMEFFVPRNDGTTLFSSFLNAGIGIFLFCWGIFSLSTGYSAWRADMAFWDIQQMRAVDSAEYSFSDALMVIQRAPELEQNMISTAEILMQREQFLVAKEVLDNLEARGTNSPEFWIAKAKYAISAEDLSSSEKFLQKAEASSGKFFAMREMMGNIWFDSFHNFERAQENFSATLNMLPPFFLNDSLGSPREYDEKRKFWKHHPETLGILDRIAYLESRQKNKYESEKRCQEFFTVGEWNQKVLGRTFAPGKFCKKPIDETVQNPQ
ncbi:MAG: O-antigen ligase family protein [Candidatus Peregrinibacteria bacterium]